MRNELIWQDAIGSLAPYYPCLMDGTLVAEWYSIVKIPNTGNNQLDYQNVRDQLEKLCRKEMQNGWQYD